MLPTFNLRLFVRVCPLKYASIECSRSLASDPRRSTLEVFVEIGEAGNLPPMYLKLAEELRLRAHGVWTWRGSDLDDGRRLGVM